MSDVCEMFNSQDAKGCKRKQDVTNFGAENEINSSDKKKQRLSIDDCGVINDQHELKCGLPYNGYSQQNLSNTIEIDGINLLDLNGSEMHLKKNVAHEELSEPMDDVDVQNNEEVTTFNVSSNAKYCPHGHLNTCTTYNVPCRYPRMYCHPSGMLEDHLAIYHGF